MTESTHFRLAGVVKVRLQWENTPTMDDEDEFVDARDVDEEEYQQGSGDRSADEAAVDGVEVFEDDDFGEFGEFAEGEVDEDGLEDYNPEAEDRFRAHEEIRKREQALLSNSAAHTLQRPKLVDVNGKTQKQVQREAFDILRERHPHPQSSSAHAPSVPQTERLDNERAMSLWNQLAAPVPLNPPDWKRSRIRRLFLVSLGVPVNLDEILPASGKKKKLVLPSQKPDSPRSTLGGKPPPQAPQFDPVSARHQSSVSSLALQNMTTGELREHVSTLKVVNVQASENLTYWLARREEAVSEKESLEGVIESLVGWTERQRKGTTGIAMVPGRGKTPPPQNTKMGQKR